METSTWVAVGALIAGILTALSAFLVKILPRITEALAARSKRIIEGLEAEARRTREGFQPTIDAMQAYIHQQELRIHSLEQDREADHARHDTERVVWVGKIQELVDMNRDCEQRVAVLTARLENLEQLVERRARPRGPTK